MIPKSEKTVQQPEKNFFRLLHRSACRKVFFDTLGSL